MTARPAPMASGPAPRWGEQTSFLQRHQVAFWLFLLVVALTGLDFLAQQLQMISAAPTAWLFTIILLVPYAIPVIAIVYLLDLYEREPISIMVAALLWGGIAATTLSLYTNTPLMEVIFKLTGDAAFTNAWSAALTAPFVEELFKGLGVVLLIAIARSELDDVLDGFVWGAMVGIGFLLVEDVFYFVRAAADSGSVGSVIQMFMIRILGAGPYSHFLYTGLTGMGLAYYHVRTDRSKGSRVLTAVALIAAGVGAHFFWNSPLLDGILGEDGGIGAWFAYVTMKGLPMLIGLLLVIRLARGRERRWFEAFTAGFRDDGSITADDMRELSGLRARRRARNAAGRERGPRGKRIKGLLQRQQIQLAIAFSRYGSEAHPEVAQRMSDILALKAEYASLGSAATGGVATAWAAAPAIGAAAGGGWGRAPQPQSAIGAAPAIQPAPGVAPSMPAWAPTHLVPVGGMPAWSAPNPALPPIVTLDARLDVAVAERAGDWARVVAVNGWSGWVDARRLVPRA